MPILRIKDNDLHYEITDFTDPWKQAETVLLHHGFARNLKLWYPWVPLLCRHFRVITLDSRGCGDSTIPPEDHHWRLEELGDDAVGLAVLAVDQELLVDHLLDELVVLDVDCQLFHRNHLVLE